MNEERRALTTAAMRSQYWQGVLDTLLCAGVVLILAAVVVREAF